MVSLVLKESVVGLSNSEIRTDEVAAIEFENMDAIPVMTYEELTYEELKTVNCVECYDLAPNIGSVIETVDIIENNCFKLPDAENDLGHDCSKGLTNENERHNSSAPTGSNEEGTPQSFPDSNSVENAEEDSQNAGNRKRKRKTAPSKWMNNETQRLRSEGKSYMGYRRSNGVVYQDKRKEARKLGAPCTSKDCVRRKARQCARITEPQRQQIFDVFWNETTWDQRKTFVANHVQTIPTKKTYTDNADSRRGITLVYNLTIDGEKWVVCKALFLSTTGLGEFTVRSWLKKNESSSSGMACSSDFKNKTRKQAHPPESKESTIFARAFLSNLPKLPSHYARSSTSKLYLETIIRSMNQLYELYCEACKPENKKPLSRCTISNIFHELNLSIHPVKKDKCDTCVKHEVGNISDEDWQIHVDKKNRARLEKEDDKRRAKLNECKVLTMDLQAVKVSPWVQASAIFYKTKLCCHNFTMYDLATREAYCFWFDETAADLTASTFATCVLQYLEEHCSDVSVPIILYSDGCTYQNRNTILSNALLSYAVDNNKVIIQKYLVVGHTQMECDSVHATIENKTKGRDINIPLDYVRITKEARKTPFPYIVKKLVFSDFKNFTLKEYQRYSSIRPGKITSDPFVTDLRALMYLPTGEIQYKLDFNHEWWNFSPLWLCHKGLKLWREKQFGPQCMRNPGK